MQKAKKYDIVADLGQVYRQSEAIIFTHYRGLTVSQVTELRKNLRNNEASFKVVKNTLSRIAACDANFESVVPMLSGPIALAYSADPISVAKTLINFTKENQNLKVLGGIVNGHVLQANQVLELSKLPSLDELRGKIVGLLQAPAQKLACILQTPATNITRVVQKRSETI